MSDAGPGYCRYLQSYCNTPQWLPIGCVDGLSHTTAAQQINIADDILLHRPAHTPNILEKILVTELFVTYTHSTRNIIVCSNTCMHENELYFKNVWRLCTSVGLRRNYVHMLV